MAKAGALGRGKLAKDAISDGDLKEALRASGVDSVAETRLIMLEPSGKIAVKAK